MVCLAGCRARGGGDRRLGVPTGAFRRWFAGSGDWAGVRRRRSAGRRRAGRAASGQGGQRADRVEDGGEVVLPGPAGGHSECPLAAGAGQAGGDLEQVAAAGSGGLDRAVSGRPIWVVQRPRLCARAAITVHALLAGKLAGGEVRKRLVFEVTDHELDRGVVAMIDVGDRGRDRCGWSRSSGGASRGTARLARRPGGCGGRSAASPPSVVSAICASPPSG